MFNSTLPEWLTNITPPTQILAAGSAAGARDYANQLASRQAQLEAQRIASQTAQQQASQQLEIQKMAAMQAAQMQDNLIAQQKLELAKQSQGIENQKFEQASKLEAQRMMGLQSFQEDLKKTGNFENSLLPHIANIFAGNPAALASVMDTRQRLDEAKANPKDTRTSDQKNAEAIINLEKQAVQAENSGDTGKAQDLRAQKDIMLSQSKGLELDMSTDEAGRPVVRLGTKGVTKDPNAATTAVKTDAQKKLTKYENSVELITKLEKNLRPQDVGIQGTLGELLVDKTLAQFVPGVADKERIPNRTVLVAVREGLLREVSDDSRFSNQDRDAITKALPSSGVFESYEDAVKKLETVKEIIRDRSLVHGRSIGVVPKFSMTPQQIGEAYKSGSMTKEEAVDLLRRFNVVKTP